MIVFKRVRFKNILSYGATFTTINLDTYATNLYVGKNASGKCLDETTTIDIEIPDQEIHKIFTEFMKNR